MRTLIYRAVLAALVLVAGTGVHAQTDSNLETKLDALQKEIQSLRKQLNEQKKEDAPRATVAPALSDRVVLGGEGAVGYIDTGDKGQFPHNEFRVDEAKLFLDVKIAESAFLVTEFEIRIREDSDSSTRIGEMFLEFSDVEKLWKGNKSATVRVGRFDIPFGEEYQTREANRNPLISHSLADLWGIDEGVEIFGDVGPFDYAAAVQNGGWDRTRDYDPDKSLTGRIGWNPNDRARISASAMRTGDLDVEKDENAEMWFANEFIRPVGAADTTAEFGVDIAEVDASWSWKGGRVSGFVGQLSYDDEDTAADNSYDAIYWSIEAVQDLTHKLFAAARYSTIDGDDKAPVTGQGYYEVDAASAAVDRIWRLSLGLGYRMTKQLVLKSEYSFERGDAANGSDIEDRDQFGAMATYGF